MIDRIVLSAFFRISEDFVRFGYAFEEGVVVRVTGYSSLLVRMMLEDLLPIYEMS